MIPNVTGGAALAAQLNALIQRETHELAQQHKNEARVEADRELALGLREADEMDEKAEDQRTGALVSGGLAMASGALQVSAAAHLSVQAPDGGAELESFRAANLQAERMGGAAGTLVPLGASANQAYSAAGDAHEAEARRAGAHARDAAHRADQARDATKEVEQVAESANQAYRSIVDAENASLQAALRVRA